MSNIDFPTIQAPGTKPSITSIFDFSAEALGQLRLWFEINPPATPITSIIGFTGFTPTAAPTILATETTNSTAYTDLATPGPSLTGLADGHYVILYSVACKAGATGVGAAASIQVNATAATDDDLVGNDNTEYITGTMFAVKRLVNDGNNTVTLKYRTVNVANTATFARRALVAIKYSNA